MSLGRRPVFWFALFGAAVAGGCLGEGGGGHCAEGLNPQPDPANCGQVGTGGRAMGGSSTVGMGGASSSTGGVSSSTGGAQTGAAGRAGSSSTGGVAAGGAAAGGAAGDSDGTDGGLGGDGGIGGTP